MEPTYGRQNYVGQEIRRRRTRAGRPPKDRGLDTEEARRLRSEIAAEVFAEMFALFVVPQPPPTMAEALRLLADDMEGRG